jgi:hypothetical protein
MTEDQQTRLTIATLFGALARALDKTNPGTLVAFRQTLEEQYGHVRDNSAYPDSFLETIRWARDSSKEEL